MATLSILSLFIDCQERHFGKSIYPPNADSLMRLRPLLGDLWTEVSHGLKSCRVHYDFYVVSVCQAALWAENCQIVRPSHVPIHVSSVSKSTFKLKINTDSKIPRSIGVFHFIC